MKDNVVVRDHLELGSKPIRETASRDLPVTVEGFFSCVCRERGKLVPGTRREGKNVWTLAGREYLARLMSYSSFGPDVAAREDRVRYIGFGIGSTPEASTVSRLVTPIAYDNLGGLFLAELSLPTYPFQTVGSFGTAVRYTREFLETELSVSTTVNLTEAGLFTDGSPTSSPVPFTPGTRNRTLAQASAQAPCAYKSFDLLKKTQNFVLQVAWEVRF
jgi:hypothetical protein